MADLFPNRGVRFLAASLGFLAFAVTMLAVVFYRYLLPAAELAKGMDSAGKKQLSAVSMGVMVIVLASLLGVLILIFRPMKAILSHKTSSRTTTRYSDAWAEAGKRVKAEESPSNDSAQS